MEKIKALVSLSGGMDSTTLLADAVFRSREVECLGFFYGSKHNPYENAAAYRIARHYKAPFHLIDLSQAMSSIQSALLKTGGAIPEGHYQESTMTQTVVPGRNLIFASVLAGIAWSKSCAEIWMGVHSGDHAIYPDCRPNFVSAMRRAVQCGTDEKVTMLTPFLHENKTSIIRLGRSYGVPYELTRTCYKDQEIACGKCGSCIERREAFRNNGVEDPIEYEYRGPLPEPPTVLVSG